MDYSHRVAYVLVGVGLATLFGILKRSAESAVPHSLHGCVLSDRFPVDHMSDALKIYDAFHTNTVLFGNVTELSAGNLYECQIKGKQWLAFVPRNGEIEIHELR